MDFPALKKVTLNERASLDRPLEDACPLMSSSARSCEFSVHYVWNGAKARLRWNTSLLERTFVSLYPLNNDITK